MWLERRPTFLRPFDALPMKERLFVRGRLASAPLVEVALRVPGGSVLDVGCGHGVLMAAIAHSRPGCRILGIDPDERKIRWARQAFADVPGVALRVATIEEVAPDEVGPLDVITIADVLYLLPVTRWAAVLASCARLLRPGGRLLLKEAEADGSWKHRKCVAQEHLMVRLFRKTQSSGGLHFMPRAFFEAQLRSAGFRIRESVSLGRGYTTPHVLFDAERMR